MTNELCLVRDEIAENLDDLAVYWKRNRENGRMPNGIRSAMIQIAREITAQLDWEARGQMANMLMQEKP